MLYLDATELLENPGLALRRVADFAGVPPLINENNFYFDEEKGKKGIRDFNLIFDRLLLYDTAS